MVLRDELLKLGLSATAAENLDTTKFERLHRPIGKIQLNGMTSRVNRTLQLLGMPERVTEGKYRSMFTKEMLNEPIVNCVSEKKFQPRNRKALDLAIKRVSKKFACGLVKPLSLEESYEKLVNEKADHFAGLPTLGKKGDDKDALERAKQCWRGKCPPPVVIGHRGKNTEIVRAVWMFPFEWHIIEASFYYAIYDIVKDNQNVYPVGVISERRYYMRKYCMSDKYDTKFSLDYSGFDASLGTQMIGIAFQVLSQMLDLTVEEEKVWKRVQTYFATSPFLAPDGLVYKGRRGCVPSGSMFTQIVDCICNAVAIEYAMIICQIKNYRYMVYGDDSWIVVKSHGEEPLVLLSRIESCVRELGLRMNALKSAYARPDEPICFCGHYDIMRGRPLQDAIDKMCYPERPSQAYQTTEGLCERIVAYMADADARLLNAVYLSYYYNLSVDDILRSGPATNLNDVTRQKVKSFNSRHLPGILQLIDSVPKEASTMMKIRSAI